MLPMVIEEINLQKCCSQINIIFSERQFLHKFEKSMNLIPLFFFNLSKVNISSVQFSHSVVSDSLQPHGLQPTRFLCPWNFPGKNTGVGSHSLLQGILPTQWSNRITRGWILYHLSHQGSPTIMDWVAYPFSSGSFRPRNWTQESHQGLLHCRLILYQLSY